MPSNESWPFHGAGILALPPPSPVARMIFLTANERTEPSPRLIWTFQSLVASSYLAPGRISDEHQTESSRTSTSAGWASARPQGGGERLRTGLEEVGELARGGENGPLSPTNVRIQSSQDC